MSKKTKKVALVILDWFGINDYKPSQNAIIQAKSPVFESLFAQNHAKLEASGLEVGLPEWQMWNSEVWHLTIWSGRKIKQSIVAIDDMFDDGTISNSVEYKKLTDHINNFGWKIHIMTLFGDGWVHSNISHLEKFLNILWSNFSICLHLFGDGRDLPPNSMLDQFWAFESKYTQKNVKVCTISGRYYAMDRDTNRDRVKLTYNEIFFAKNNTKLNPSEYIKSQYEKNITDEFLSPVSFQDYDWVRDDDAIVFLNFRSDRAKQLTKAMTNLDFQEFTTKKVSNMFFVSMTKYEESYAWPYFYHKNKLENTLWEVISKNWLKQLRLAETEKFAHVTRFFNGEKDIIYDWQTNILVPSHKVATYDLDPDMSADEIYEKFEENISKYEFFVINFANGDMVWHTGSMKASIQAVRTLDRNVSKIIELCKKHNVELLLTADHGNCDDMGTDKEPITSHTTNLVPFWYISWWKVLDVCKYGSLRDIAPTVLDLMWINIPIDMDWKSLIKL